MTSRISYILLLAACILLLTLMLSIRGNFLIYVDNFREAQTLEVYLSSSASAQQLETLVNTIKDLPGYRTFELQEKERAFEHMQSLLGEQLLPDKSRNPFPNRIVIGFTSEFSDLDHFRSVAPTIQTSSIVDTVTFNAAWLAAEEQAFSQWDYIIHGTLILTIVAGVLALFLCVLYAEEQSRNMLQTLRLHGAGLGLLTRRFVLSWVSLTLLAAVLGIAAAYLIWLLLKTRFATESFVDPTLLVLAGGCTLVLATAGLLIKLLRYR